MMKDRRQFQLQSIQPSRSQKDMPDQKDILSINYSIHMHPITRIKIPDFMDRDKQSTIDITCSITYSMLPMFLNFILNHASSYTNIYIIGMYNDKQLFCQICLGNIIAYTLVYYVIEYLAAGFAIICTYFTEKQEIGYLYQKTLGITYIICVFMTPVIFVSDNFLNLFQFNETLIQKASIYAWALVPSYYLQSFLHVNKNYLQTQGIIFPPILIHLVSSVAHIVICAINHSIHPLTMKRVAWIKNITDGLCCLILYLFIIVKQPTKDSWVEWSIKATHNIQKFLKEIVYHESFIYFEIMAFQIVSTIACLLSYKQMAAHFSYSLIYMFFYFWFISLSHCLNKSIALSIQDNEIKTCKKKVSLGCLMALLISVVAIINIIQHRQYVSVFFVHDVEVKTEMMKVLSVFCFILFFEGLNIITTGIVKTLQVDEVWKYSFFLYYIIGISMSSVLCYYFQNGVKGIWVGWLISIIISLVMNLKSILSLDFEQVFERVRDRYKMIKQDFRQSKMQLMQDN